MRIRGMGLAGVVALVAAGMWMIGAGADMASAARRQSATAGGKTATAGAKSTAAKAGVAADPRLINVAEFEKIVAENKGKPLVVTFWATWCEPCRDEYPMLNELAKQYAPQGLVVVGVSLDDDGDLILMRRFLARYKPVFTNYRKKAGEQAEFIQAVLPGWNGAIPATFFYARDGRQIGHFVGEGTRDVYEAAIKQVIAAGQ